MSWLLFFKQPKALLLSGGILLVSLLALGFISLRYEFAITGLNQKITQRDAAIVQLRLNVKTQQAAIAEQNKAVGAMALDCRGEVDNAVLNALRAQATSNLRPIPVDMQPGTLNAWLDALYTSGSP